MGKWHIYQKLIQMQAMWSEIKKIDLICIMWVKYIMHIW